MENKQTTLSSLNGFYSELENIKQEQFLLLNRLQKRVGDMISEIKVNNQFCKIVGCSNHAIQWNKNGWLCEEHIKLKEEFSEAERMMSFDDEYEWKVENGLIEPADEDMVQEGEKGYGSDYEERLRNQYPEGV